MDLLCTFKFCPACKNQTLTLNEQKIITCQNCGFIYFHNTAAAVAAIIEDDSGILLVKRAKEPKASMFDLPGGFVDYNESAQQALIREVHEELNLKIINLSFLTSAPNIYIYKDIQYFVLDIFFTCKAANFEDIKPNAEIEQFLFLPPDEVPINELAFDSTKSALKFYLASLKKK